MAVTGIAGLRVLIGRNGRIMLAEFFADAGKREPGRGEVRRKLDRLQQQIRGGGQIALQLQVAGELKPAVSHQIAGGEKQSRGHEFQDQWAVKPAHDG